MRFLVTGNVEPDALNLLLSDNEIFYDLQDGMASKDYGDGIELFMIVPLIRIEKTAVSIPKFREKNNSEFSISYRKSSKELYIHKRIDYMQYLSSDEMTRKKMLAWAVLQSIDDIRYAKAVPETFRREALYRDVQEYLQTRELL